MQLEDICKTTECIGGHAVACSPELSRLIPYPELQKDPDVERLGSAESNFQDNMAASSYLAVFMDREELKGITCIPLLVHVIEMFHYPSGLAGADLFYTTNWPDDLANEYHRLESRLAQYHSDDDRMELRNQQVKVAMQRIDAFINAWKLSDYPYYENNVRCNEGKLKHDQIV